LCGGKCAHNAARNIPDACSLEASEALGHNSAHEHEEQALAGQSGQGLGSTGVGLDGRLNGSRHILCLLHLLRSRLSGRSEIREDIRDWP